MRKRIRPATLILFFLLPLTAAAKSIVFTLSSGTLVYYLIGDTQPVMKFVDGKCVVSSDTYEFSQIKNFYVSDTDDPSAISQLNTPASFSLNNNTMVCKADAKDVQVYTVAGAKCNAAISANDGYATLDLSSFPQGAYIIKIGQSSIKVVKR